MGRPLGGGRPQSTYPMSSVVTGLTNGKAYRFGVQTVAEDGEYSEEALTGLVTPKVTTTRPAAPGIGKAVSGASGGKITAKAVWKTPATTGGSPITGYRVSAHRISSTGATLSTTVSGLRAASSRAYSMPLPRKGKYRFSVVAVNAIGDSPPSPRSNLVTGR